MLIIFLISLAISGCASQADINSLNKQVEALNAEITSLNSKNEELTNENKKLIDENEQLQAKVAEAEPWFKMTKEQQELEQQKIEEEKAAAEKKKKEQEEQAKLEAQQKAEAEKAAREAEEKKGYDTGITYEQLARNPDDYKSKKVKFTGEAIQVLYDDDSNETDIRLAIDYNYDTIILAVFDSDIMSSRILEDDNITIYGTSQGLYTYKSTGGGPITVPLVIVDKIELNN